MIDLKATKCILSFVVFLLLQSPLFAQKDFGVLAPDNGNYAKKCGQVVSIIHGKPPEVHWGFRIDEMHNIHFVMTDMNWFNQIFTKSKDGIAVDIITKDQFACGVENDIARSAVRRGKMLAPVYYKDFKKDMVVTKEGTVIIKMGILPLKYRKMDYELNMIIVKNGYICYYQNFFSLSDARWSLLDMGLYIDTISYQKRRSDTSQFVTEVHKVFSKKLKFVIPFEKNKYDYSPKDIKPLYDSLKLTDYNIYGITIKSYSSVEGSTETNIKLQNRRAGTIVQALQSYQKMDIKANIICSENWVEFINDVSSAGYSELVKLSKTEIKNKLNEGGMSKELEYLLKNHRKAVIILDLEKKTKYMSSSGPVIKSFYEKSLKEKNIDEAMEIQNVIFSRIRHNTLPEDFLSTIEVPKEVEYGNLLNNRIAFDYEQNEDDMYSALVAYRELEDLLPDDKHIKYNICVLQVRSLLFGMAMIEPKELLRNIEALKVLGIDRRLLKRLLINYYIILSEHYMFQRNYKAKDMAVNFIYKNYRYLRLEQRDYLQLAKYFSSYAKYDWAEKILKPQVIKIDIDEDLLFYYLNLTIIDPNNTKRTKYRSIMLNAVNINKRRFCTMFEPNGKGGINFQLLRDEYLKNTYCENCN